MRLSSLPYFYQSSIAFIMDRIDITKTFFPPIKDYQFQLQRIWKNGWLTNRGELVKELEIKLKSYLDSPQIICMANGTIPLQIAMKILGKRGEIITTPFSYIATSSSIIWEECTPVFVDINEDYLTIDESKIEASITPNTTAILATHVFGNPCNVEAIDKIAKTYNLHLVYDASHCFGVKYSGKSIFSYGDISTCSFHATKIFQTAEGGALFSNDENLFHRYFFSHNFGHNGLLKFDGLGINGKMSELQAAMGLAMLPYMSSIIQSRKDSIDYYLQNLYIKNLKFLKIRNKTEWNYCYFPVIFESEHLLLNVQSRLNEKNIFPRRYFYPSLNTINYINGSSMPISETIASRILCLPLFNDMPKDILNKICYVINNI